ncbi:MerR family transcriptional regulator [Fulvivirga sp. 29W222]|uniref:MerR family transcriptional regulator n=1 Tax=Fulvivirga marina TaxID=2494733 RepID=A0A937KD07_9BACT|nr:MerR family transcriptional regulator [Fulvivirga marina]MBL6445743.1 MerR family transcriptional regulator [Fulvivirga marina]
MRFKKMEKQSSFITQNFEDLHDTLTNKQLSLKDTGQNHRVINNWAKQGIIEDERSDQEKWRRFSLMDIIWLSIIDDFRSFGMGLPAIKEVYDHLVAKKAKRLEVNGKSLSQLELAVLQVFHDKGLRFMVTDSQGNAEILSETDFKSKTTDGSIDNHIVISLNRTINENFEEIAFAPTLDRGDLTKEERDLLDIIRNGNFLSIKARLKDGQITMIEGVERMANKKRIIEILNEGSFQDIELRQENGKVVSVHRTLKKKY